MYSLAGTSFASGKRSLHVAALLVTDVVVGMGFVGNVAIWADPVAERSEHETFNIRITVHVETSSSISLYLGFTFDTS